MRVTVYHTGQVKATEYFDVEVIIFDRKNNAKLVFYTGEEKIYTSPEYTDIDCKKGETWKVR